MAVRGERDNTQRKGRHWKKHWWDGLNDEDFAREWHARAAEAERARLEREKRRRGRKTTRESSPGAYQKAWARLSTKGFNRAERRALEPLDVPTEKMEDYFKETLRAVVRFNSVRRAEFDSNAVRLDLRALAAAADGLKTKADRWATANLDAMTGNDWATMELLRKACDEDSAYLEAIWGDAALAVRVEAKSQGEKMRWLEVHPAELMLQTEPGAALRRAFVGLLDNLSCMALFAETLLWRPEASGRRRDENALRFLHDLERTFVDGTGRRGKSPKGPFSQYLIAALKAAGEKPPRDVMDWIKRLKAAKA